MNHNLYDAGYNSGIKHGRYETLQNIENLIKDKLNKLQYGQPYTLNNLLKQIEIMKKQT